MDRKEQCFSCGIKHKDVECIGIWHCPNALCLGCGGAWFRYTLNSYGENDCGCHHNVDPNEWVEKGRAYNKENGIRRTKFYRIAKSKRVKE